MRNFVAIFRRTQRIVVSQTPLAIRLARAFADAGNIPMARGILEIAILIMETLESVEADLEYCRHIAERASGLTLAVYDAMSKRARQQSDYVEENTDVFKRVLTDSLLYIMKITSWSRFQRFFLQTSIRKSLVDIDSRISAAYDNLIIKISITTQNTLIDANRTLGDIRGRIHMNLDDEHFRVFRIGDIHLERQLDLDGSWNGSRFARVSGEVCLVKVYHVSEGEKFRRDLAFGREARIEFIPQVFGYATGAQEKYIVYSLDTGGHLSTLKPMMEHIAHEYKNDSTFDVRRVLRLPVDIVKALQYLDERNVITSEEDIKRMLQVSELVIGPTGNILIGTGGLPFPVTIPDDNQQQYWADQNASRWLRPERIPRVAEITWIVGVLFHGIFEDFCQKNRNAPEMETIKFAHDILHDNCEAVLRFNWNRAPHFNSIRECRRITGGEYMDGPDSCIYIPSHGSPMPSPGDVAVWMKENGRRELMTPDFSCGINIAQEIMHDGGITDRFSKPQLHGGLEEMTYADLLNGIVRYSFKRPNQVKLWDARGGCRSSIDPRGALAYLRGNVTLLADALNCPPQDVMIVTLKQEHFIRAEFDPVLDPTGVEPDEYYFYIHCEDTVNPRRAYWSLDDTPCTSGTPDVIPGCTVTRWSLFNYVQLTAEDIASDI